MDNLTERFNQLYLAGKSAVSLESSSDADYVLHVDAQESSLGPSSTKVAATSSNFNVTLFSQNNLALIGSIEGHDKVLTGVRFAKTNAELIYTASLDGTIRSWDMRASLQKPVQIYEGYEATHNAFTSFDISCNDQTLCAGTEVENNNVYLIFWDCRKGQTLRVYAESHQDDVTQVKFHPSKVNHVITGSTDGLVCLFDVTEEDEEDALQATFNSESSVSQIGWCGKDYNHIYCLTHIETLHMWETEEFDPVCEITNIKDTCIGKCHMEYLIDCFQVPSLEKTLLLTGESSGTAHILEVNVTEQCLHHVSSLSGGHKDVVRCMTWDHQECNLVTGGEDSMLCLWSADSDITNKPTLAKADKKSTSKIKSKKKKLDAKPY